MKIISNVESDKDSTTAKQAVVSLLELIRRQSQPLLLELAKSPNEESYYDFNFFISKSFTSLLFITDNHVVDGKQVHLEVDALKVLQRQLKVYGTTTELEEKNHALKEVCYIARDKLDFKISEKIINRIEHQDLQNLPF